MNKLILLIACLIPIPALTQDSDVYKKLGSLGINLPEVKKPLGNYVKAVRTGNLVFLSGHGSIREDGTNITGKVGRDLTIEQGYEAARHTAIQLLATLQAELSDLNKVKCIIKVFGMVNCYPDFTEQPKVINGCSDLLVAVFGDNGKHARSAVGVSSLPINLAVEIELVVEVE